jgi:hypothetical protein
LKILGKRDSRTGDGRLKQSSKGVNGLLLLTQGLKNHPALLLFDRS